MGQRAAADERDDVPHASEADKKEQTQQQRERDDGEEELKALQRCTRAGKALGGPVKKVEVRKFLLTSP